MAVHFPARFDCVRIDVRLVPGNAAPEVLSFRNAPAPLAGPGEVRVRLVGLSNMAKAYLAMERGDKLGPGIVDSALTDQDSDVVPSSTAQLSPNAASPSAR
jgi:hypothetical protein